MGNCMGCVVVVATTHIQNSLIYSISQYEAFIVSLLHFLVVGKLPLYVRSYTLIEFLDSSPSLLY